MFRNKTMRLKLRKMKELRRFFLKKSKKKLAKSKSKSGKKRDTKKQIKKIFKLRRNKKFKKTQKGGVNFQLFTDMTRSGLNEANDVQKTFLGN